MNFFKHFPFYSLFHFVHGELHSEANTCSPNVTKSTKLQGAQRAPELVLRSMKFRSPENLIFPALV